jgi:hypothetical protein
MPHKNYLIRQAASLLRFARETRNPEVATTLLAKAADFNEKRVAPRTNADPDASLRAPDVEVGT